MTKENASWGIAPIRPHDKRERGARASELPKPCSEGIWVRSMRCLQADLYPVSGFGGTGKVPLSTLAVRQEPAAVRGAAKMFSTAPFFATCTIRVKGILAEGPPTPRHSLTAAL